ncbi:MAG TPA: MATE family efflux transporter [Candidatus Scatomorpha gallistercoris]|nr:MATE family efflux transporter [Candidatus Scatomorpha gallistercoris]
MDQTFMKTRPVFPLLMSMALPMVISMLVNSLYNIVDSYFVSQISDAAFTALSLVYPVQNFVNAVGIGFGVGINAVIALHLGAQEQEKADSAASQGMFLAGIQGLVLSVACILIMPGFLGLYTTDEQIVELGVRYSTVVFGFGVMVSLGVGFEKVFQAVGLMKVSMISLMAGCIANIILDPIMIFGWGPIPAMGIEGAALATGIGQTLSFLIYVAAYFMKPIGVRVTPRLFRPRAQMAARLYSVGIPAVLNLALPSLLISALNGILSSFSELYVQVLGAYYKLQTFLYLTVNGVVQGMRPLVGYNFGAKEYGRVNKLYKLVLILSAAFMALGTVIFLAIPGQLASLFAENEETIRASETALRIISAGFIVSAVSVTSSGALEGLGKGAASLLISLCRYVVVIIPVAYLLSRLIGPTGVWHAFWITEFISAAVAYIVYRRAVRVV